MDKKQITTAGKMKSKVLIEFRKTIEIYYKRKDKDNTKTFLKGEICYSGLWMNALQRQVLKTL